MSPPIKLHLFIQYFVTDQPTPTQYFVTAQLAPTQYFVTAQPTLTQNSEEPKLLNEQQVIENLTARNGKLSSFRFVPNNDS